MTMQSLVDHADMFDMIESVPDDEAIEEEYLLDY